MELVGQERREFRLREAIDHYERALLVNPNDRGARANLTKLKARQAAP